jgi:hypothetical protein
LDALICDDRKLCNRLLAAGLAGFDLARDTAISTPDVSQDASSLLLMRKRQRVPDRSSPSACAASASVAMVVSVSSFVARVQRKLEWADQARRTARASIAFPQGLRLLFSPAAEVRHSSRDTKKAGCRRPSLALRA